MNLGCSLRSSNREARNLNRIYLRFLASRTYPLAMICTEPDILYIRLHCDSVPTDRVRKVAVGGIVHKQNTTVEWRVGLSVSLPE